MGARDNGLYLYDLGLNMKRTFLRQALAASVVLVAAFAAPAVYAADEAPDVLINRGVGVH